MRRSWTPTLPELQAFAACAETGSATRAATRLGLTQSAVSRALAGLEARLGARLFLRVRQRLLLSDAGRALLPEAQRILAGLDAAAMTVMAFGGRPEVLRIAALPTFATEWLVPRLPRFAAAAPDVAVDLSATLDAVDFGALPLDLAILRADVPAGAAGDGGSLRLCEERLVAVAAPALLPGGRPLADAALVALPLLQQATRPDLWLHWFRDAGIDPIATLRGPRFEQFGMVLAAARAGLGVALVPDILAAGDLRRGALRRASDRTMAGPLPYALVWPARSAARDSVRRFRDWLMVEVAAPGSAAAEVDGKAADAS
ncbi:LysR substrate-binding domain-containing protein [Frigidibacter oleivorans]|uniref:LysR substrate-binding domain-containing protein n=1 Tax=Frigidibacter oleivorans TaxID=2487129 RepID=UPI000F8CDB5A|nr:LysR substrate-binding domain-containing protein [Frigidibacter oleivorans]